MNQETKLVFALEHVAHLEDLIEGNDWEDYLKRSVLKLKSRYIYCAYISTLQMLFYTININSLATFKIIHKREYNGY